MARTQDPVRLPQTVSWSRTSYTDSPCARLRGRDTILTELYGKVTMADTQRTLQALRALLADNTSQAISPQDIRDFLETFIPGHASAYISSTAATVLSDTSTWIQVAGTYSLSSEQKNWNQAVAGQLDYDGPEDRLVTINCGISMTCVSNNQTVEIGIGKNGTIWTPSIGQRKVGTGADVGRAAITAQLRVVSGDYLSVMWRNITGANNLTAEAMTVGLFDAPIEVSAT